MRPFELDDLDKYRQWVNDPVIGSLVDRVLPVTEMAHDAWYHNLMGNRNAVVFAVDTVDEQRYIGNVWLWNIDLWHRRAEVRILLGQDHGMGYGTDVLKQIVAFAFSKLDLHKLYAYVLSRNKRAVKAFARVGFVVEGTLKKDRFIDGDYRDVLLMALQKVEQ